MSYSKGFDMYWFSIYSKLWHFLWNSIRRFKPVNPKCSYSNTKSYPSLPWSFAAVWSNMSPLIPPSVIKFTRHQYQLTSFLSSSSSFTLGTRSIPTLNNPAADNCTRSSLSAATNEMIYWYAIKKYYGFKAIIVYPATSKFSSEVIFWLPISKTRHRRLTTFQKCVQ